MLKNIHVKNFALIDEVEIDLAKGLNVLTGETGAGKSIIIDAVNFALGNKVSKDVVREDAEYALSELVFSIDNEFTEKILNKYDIYSEDGEIVLSRKITGGKSTSRINGETVTAKILREIATWLVDIHGQHDNQSLFNKSLHMSLLDSLLEEELSSVLPNMKSDYDEYKKAEAELLDIKNMQNAKEADYLSFQLEEIDNASLKIGEDEELESAYRKMNSSKKIAEAVTFAHRLTGYDSEGAGGNVGRALSYIKQISDLDEGAKDLELILTDIDSLLNDFNRTVADYELSLDFSDEDYYEVESRINTINSVKSKYGDSVEQVLETREKIATDLEKLLNIEEYKEKLEKKVNETHEAYLKHARIVSDIRKKGAASISEQMVEALKDLNFLDARFEIRVTSDEDVVSSNGIDDVEFFVSTNPGEKLKPLTMVASGGEISRIMLAIKSIVANKDQVPTLIFDEIDTGISGRTAQKVSEKMGKIAKDHQVIVVTHLPQIAAMADNHFEISKQALEGRTVTSINRLNDEEIITELARMLGGVSITDAVVENAKDMKNQANETKLLL